MKSRFLWIGVAFAVLAGAEAAATATPRAAEFAVFAKSVQPVDQATSENDLEYPLMPGN